VTQSASFFFCHSCVSAEKCLLVVQCIIPNGQHNVFHKRVLTDLIISTLLAALTTIIK